MRFPLPLVVAITGASSGIGRATAERSAAAGADVVLLARRVDRLEAVAAAIRANGGRAVALRGDVSAEADCRALVTRAVEAYGRLDVMICNAGVGFHGTLDDTPPDVMRRLVDVNLMGTLYAARAALEVFRRQQTGHLIVVSSIVGRRGVPGAGVYAATKAAQVGLVESLRAELRGSDVHASIVYPVSTETEFREAQARDYGRVVDGRGPRRSASSVADAIVRCIASPRPEVYPYPLAKGLVVASAIAPGVGDRLARRFGRRVQAPGDA